MYIMCELIISNKQSAKQPTEVQSARNHIDLSCLDALGFEDEDDVSDRKLYGSLNLYNHRSRIITIRQLLWIFQ
jgi:hypothetical protein